MRRLLPSFLLALLLAGAAPPVRGDPFVSIAFHDVVDQAGDLETDSVTSDSLAQFFDWLKGSGWTAVSLDDLAAAARGTRSHSSPPAAVLPATGCRCSSTKPGWPAASATSITL